MEISPDILIADLESKYKKISNEVNKGRFFLKVADYGRYLIEKTDYFEKINLFLSEDSKSDKKDFDISFKKFIKEWKPLVKDILILAKKTGIEDNKNDPLNCNIIQRLKGSSLNPSFPELLGDIEYLYTPYLELIKKFKEEGEEKKLIGKHINKEGEIILYKTYRDTQIQWDSFKNRREISTWWAHFNIIRLAFGVFKLNGIEKFSITPNRVIDGIYQYEFDQISKGNSQNLMILSENKFKDWIDLLHNYLIPRLKAIPSDEWEEISRKEINEKETSAIKSIPKNWSLKETTNKLSILKGKNVVYIFPRIDSNKCKYFKKIWNGNGVKVGFIELYESIGLSYPHKKGQNNKVNKSVRDTLRKLNNEFKKSSVPITLIEKKGYTINFK